MSFWDPEKMEEDRKRREEEDRRRREEYDRLAKKRKQAEQLRQKQAKLKKKAKRDAEEAQNELLAEGDLADEVFEEPWIPPKLNRGFAFAPGSPTLTQEAYTQIQKNEAEMQKRALEESQKAAAKEDSYSGPRLIRPF